MYDLILMVGRKALSKEGRGLKEISLATIVDTAGREPGRSQGRTGVLLLSTIFSQKETRGFGGRTEMTCEPVPQGPHPLSPALSPVAGLRAGRHFRRHALRGSQGMTSPLV